MVKWFILAMQFGTVVPMPAIQDATDADIRRSVLFFPLIGGVLGAVLWAVQWIATHFMVTAPATAISLALYTVLTGALHLDGLMDTADAIGSRRPREAALLIMKDSRIGAMGAVAAVLVLIGKFAAISSLSPLHFAPFIIVPMVSRLAMVWSMAVSPSARPDGLGGFFARKVPRWVVASATLVSGLVCVVLLPAMHCLLVGLYFIIVLVFFQFWMLRKFGGTTGDTYGALNEVMEWVGWLVFAAMSR